jgi:hypothetical protein
MGRTEDRAHEGGAATAKRTMASMGIGHHWLGRYKDLFRQLGKRPTIAREGANLRTPSVADPDSNCNLGGRYGAGLFPFVADGSERVQLMTGRGFAGPRRSLTSPDAFEFWFAQPDRAGRLPEVSGLCGRLARCVRVKETLKCRIQSALQDMRSQALPL